MKKIKSIKVKDQELLNLGVKVAEAQVAEGIWMRRYIQLNQKWWRKAREKYSLSEEPMAYDPETKTIAGASENLEKEA